MTNSYKLKKCPFCGSRRLALRHRQYLIGSWAIWVQCEECKAQGGEIRTHKDPAEVEPTEAIKEMVARRWNERKGED